MRLVPFCAIVLFAAAFFLLFGCAGSNLGTLATTANRGGALAGASPSSPSANAAASAIAFYDGYGNEVSSIPAAYMGQEYYTEIYPISGAYPFACALTQDSRLPGELAFAKGTCELSGRAPLLTSAGSTRAEYPFTFTMKDADGRASGPFTITLTVLSTPPTFVMINFPKSVQMSSPYSNDFCHPASANPLNCGHTPAADDPAGGVPPYTFTASNLPLGLIMRADGNLAGTVPKEVAPGKQPIEVCATDMTGGTACINTTLTLLAPAEKWHGVFVGSTKNSANSNYVTAGTSFSYDYTADFDFSTSLFSVLGNKDQTVIENGNGTLSGKQTVLSQSKFGPSAGVIFTGGSVSNVPFEIQAFGGSTSTFAEITAAKPNANFISAYREDFHSDGSLISHVPFFTDRIHLAVTSASPTSISGTWQFSEQYDTRPKGSNGITVGTGTFTLTKIG